MSILISFHASVYFLTQMISLQNFLFLPWTRSTSCG